MCNCTGWRIQLTDWQKHSCTRFAQLCWRSCLYVWRRPQICINIHPDAVPPIHAVSYHVVTDKHPSKDGDKFPSILATIYNQLQLAERKHVARYWLINTAATAVPLSAHPSALVITTKWVAAIFGGGCTEEVFCPCGANALRLRCEKMRYRYINLATSSTQRCVQCQHSYRDQPTSRMLVIVVLATQWSRLSAGARRLSTRRPSRWMTAVFGFTCWQIRSAAVWGFAIDPQTIYYTCYNYPNR